MIPQGFRRTRLAAAVVTVLSMAAPLAADIPGYTLKRRTDFSQEIHPRVVAAAPDGKVWFADERYTPHSVGFFTPSDGKVTKFPIPCDGCDAGAKLAYVESITVGPDGNAWFVWTHVGSDGSPLNGGINSFVSKVTTAGAFTSYAIQTKDAFRRYIFGSISNSMIASGPDGNLWFTENSANGGQPPKVGKITTAGAITEYTVPTNFAAPSGITGGPDGNVWFAETERAKIARITPAGTITEFPLPTGVYPYDIVQAPDGKLWFTDRTGKLGRVTTSGAVTMYDLDPKSGATQIAVGKDNNLYFTYTVTTDNVGNYEGRIGQVVLQNVPASAAKIVTNITLPSLSFEALINKAIPFDLTATDGGLFATAGEPDASGQTVDFTYELQDESAVPECGLSRRLVPAPGPLASGTVGRPYVLPGGQGVVAILVDGLSVGEQLEMEIIGGRLPIGLRLYTFYDGDGFVIEGTPAEGGDFTIVVRATVSSNATGPCTLTGTYTIHIDGPSSPALNVKKSPFPETARAGSDADYSFSIEPLDVDREIRIVDPLPSGMHYKDSWVSIGTGTLPAPPCTAGPPVTCTFVLEAGLPALLSMKVELLSASSGAGYVNVADVTATTSLGPVTTKSVTADELVVVEGRTVDALTPEGIQPIGGRP